ncbi:hypothetical protein, variant [Capsaspora owczarzaki ATCC 30864]|nr:hypothetical protein, variant [Capsaspora owczarzaki ATCC 30864]
MIKEGKGAFNIDGAKIAGPCKGMGCTTTDGAMCISGCICQILPCVYPLWRGDLRQKYGIKGSLVGDFLALCYCCTCAIMQDSREIKVQGLGYGNLTSKTMDKA